MLYKNLTVRDMFMTMHHNEVIEIFEKGLDFANDRLAGSAMEELLRRGDTDAIAKTLNKFYAEHCDFDERSSYGNMLYILKRDLSDNCREEDSLLGSYAKCSNLKVSPTEWVKQNAEQFKKVYRSGAVRKAKPWAKQYLVREENKV